MTIRLNSNFEKFEHGTSLFYFSLNDYHTQTQWPKDGYQTQLQAIAIADLTNAKIIRREPLFTNHTSVHSSPSIWQNIIWIGSLTIIGFAIWITKRKKKESPAPSNPVKSMLVADGLMYENQLHPLDRIEIAILRLLLDSDREVQTADLLDVVGRPELDYTHNLRVKNQTVESLNLKLRSILRINENPILILRSPMDRRIHVYQIKKDLFA